MAADRSSGFLLLIHQIPPTPAYLRVKIGRQLQRLGAVAIKSSVYALPRSDSSREHLEWLLQEIVKGGGDGSICEARFVEGLTDGDVEAMFVAARDADYEALTQELRAAAKASPKRHKLDDRAQARLASDVRRFTRALAEVTEIDFFGSPRRGAAEALLTELAARVAPDDAAEPGGTVDKKDYRGRIWITRKGIHVDRMASAWLIRRFIDRDADVRFVPGKGHKHAAGELRFDMFGGEFTHEGDRCTFEVLCARMGLADPGLRALGEVVHDIDLRDGKFGRPETGGIATVITAIASAHREDAARLERATMLFDDLYSHYQARKRQGET